MDHRRPALTHPFGRRAPAALAALPFTVLVAVFAWPVATILTRALDLSAVRDVVTNPGIRSVVWFTVWQAVVSTVATLAVGLAPAAVVARYRFRGRRLFLALVTAPFVLPTVVVGSAFLAVLPDAVDRSAFAILLAHVYFNLAIVVRTVGTGWAAIDPSLAAAARCLGAGPFRAFRTVTLPLLRPSIGSAAALVFVFSATSYGVVRILGGPGRATVEVEIFLRATQLGDLPGASVLAVVQLVIVAVVFRSSTGRSNTWGVGVGASEPHRRARTPGERLTVIAVVGAVVAFVVAPLAAIAVRSVRSPAGWTSAGWTSLENLSPLWNSLRVATVSTGVVLVLGCFAAGAIAYGAGRWLDTALMLPLATSAVTLGFGIVITYDEPPLDLRGSAAIVPLVHAVVALPFLVRSLVPVLDAVPSAQRSAAATLGASPVRVWWTIDRPAAMPAVASGGAFAFVISLGEFGATSFLTRSSDETLPVTIARLLGRTGDVLQTQAYALATILLVATLVVVVAVDSFVASSGRRAVGLPRRAQPQPTRMSV